LALNDTERAEVDRGFELAISGVEVWRGVIVLKNIRIKIP
jgi:hypothetical protein